MIDNQIYIIFVVQMRVVLIILSILVFRQSVTVCMPSIQNIVVSDKDSGISCKHSCCKKMQSSADKDTDNSSQDSDQKCKCGSCKVISISPLLAPKTSKIIPVLLILNYSGIRPVLTHSYDFHAKISCPPQV